MVAILMTTDTFRRNITVSRWRDPAWLAWLAVPLYWIHQFEEYSLPVIGNAGLLVYAAVIGFAPIILAAIASRFFKPELLRSVPVQQATA